MESIKPCSYEKIRLLGEGSFGKAYLSKNLLTNEMVVIKEITLAYMNENEKKRSLNEVSILSTLHHPNIIGYKEVYQTTKPKLCIVMEYAEGGDLAKRISEKKKKGASFSETQIVEWFCQICLAIKHIHDLKIMHRDLKCQNIFLTREKIVKVGDFGIARVMNSSIEKAQSVVGSPYYMAPEIFNDQLYNLKADIWSLGIVLYEICNLKPPFKANSLSALAMKVIKRVYEPFKSNYSKEIKSLFLNLLTKDPLKRPDINEVLS